MMISNLHESENNLKEIHNTCRTNLAQDSRDCQNCRYRHKGICDEFFGQEFNNSHKNIKNLEEGVEIMLNSGLEDSEPVLNLKNLFYETKINYSINQLPEVVQKKAKYDNFKLLTDIQNVLQNCRHLTDRDRLNYCNTQRYFMKLYLREINKPEKSNFNR
ncbi:MAG: hypothetical protein ACFFA0_15485 [Promethearchaeota archaeon]